MLVIVFWARKKHRQGRQGPMLEVLEDGPLGPLLPIKAQEKVGKCRGSSPTIGGSAGPEGTPPNSTLLTGGGDILSDIP